MAAVPSCRFEGGAKITLVIPNPRVRPGGVLAGARRWLCAHYKDALLYVAILASTGTPSPPAVDSKM